MYGTIFNLKVKSGHEKDLLSNFNIRDMPEGMGAWFLMEPDDKNKDWIGVAVLTSKEAHINNSNKPQTHQGFIDLMKHLESDPVWTDGNYIISEVV